ncbi:MAG: GGDEF domain-containing protein [bacterium]|nr:MAG: GGDEF domain-containing protein [bacterium]
MADNIREDFKPDELEWKDEEEKSLRDFMTGAFSRNAFEVLAPRQFEESLRNNTPLTLVVIDLNDFKAVNDTLGHPEGDRRMTMFAKDLQNKLRDQDYFFRYGGDEFVLLMHSTDSQVAESKVLPKINNSLKLANLNAAIGFAGRVPEDTLETLLGRADQLMYKNKDEFRSKKNV